MHCGKDIVKIANFIAICIFNEKFYTILRIIALIGINVDKQAKIFTDFLNVKHFNRLTRTGPTLLS